MKLRSKVWPSLAALHKMDKEAAAGQTRRYRTLSGALNGQVSFIAEPAALNAVFNTTSNTLKKTLTPVIKTLCYFQKNCTLKA